MNISATPSVEWQNYSSCAIGGSRLLLLRSYAMVDPSAHQVVVGELTSLGRSGERPWEFRCEGFSDLHVSANGLRVAVACKEGVVVMSVKTGSILERYEHATGMAFTPEGQIVTVNRHGMPSWNGRGPTSH